ncbi:MAG: mechanosensitive ion channel family protein [Spirochaetaceae bacterium]|nr:mechanosensitive ion channel family protein [Spirochaetaceae bacterium]
MMITLLALATTTVTKVAQSGVDMFFSYFDSIKFWKDAGFSDLFNTIITGLLIVLIGWAILKFVVKGLLKVFLKAKTISDLLGEYIVKIVYVVGWILLILTFFTHLGIDMGPMITGLGVTGIVLGLALQDSLSNFFSGFMIILNQPFRKGDYIEVGAYSGTVKSMDLICIQLTTFDGKLITMSNRVIWNAPIMNYSFTDKRRVNIVVGVPYNTNLIDAKQVFIDIINSYPEVLSDPAPAIEINELANSSINFVIRPWVRPEDYWMVFFRFNGEITQKLAEKKIFLPFPQMDIHIKD